MEEGNGILIPDAHSPPSDHVLVGVEDYTDLPATADPDLAEPQPPTEDQTKTDSSEERRRKIIKQAEYYFSDENLPHDDFLLKYVMSNAEGFVPIGVIASFKKMKKLTRDTSLIVAALKESPLLVVSSNGKKVKRLFPLLLEEVKDPMARTVLVENLPDDHSLENIRRVFGEAGNITNITIRNPHDARDPKKLTVAEKLISGKLHALVEYDTIDAAEKAAATLNNEQDWRHGLRVKLLKILKKKYLRVSETAKVSSNQTPNPDVHVENHCSGEHHDDSQDAEVEDHLSSGKNVPHLPKENYGHKGQNRGRGRKKYQGTNGHGRGTQGSIHIVEPSKPPPGPKMPDGTRGFTMGRGRPLYN